MRSTYLALVAAAFLGLQPAVNAIPIVIDFEGQFDGDAPLVAGLTFSDAIVLTAGISLNEFDFPPRSGSNVVVDGSTPLAILFDVPVFSVSGYFTYVSAITLSAFDAADQLLGSITSSFINNAVFVGDAGSSPNELLALTSQVGITRVEIASGAPSSFTLDDFTFDHDQGPPVVSVPEPGSLPLLLVGVLMLVGRSVRNRSSKA